MEPETTTRTRRSWPLYGVFLGVGMMIGGSTDMVGSGGGMFIIGLLVALCGAVGWTFSAK